MGTAVSEEHSATISRVEMNAKKFVTDSTYNMVKLQNLKLHIRHKLQKTKDEEYFFFCFKQ